MQVRFKLLTTHRSLRPGDSVRTIPRGWRWIRWCCLCFKRAEMCAYKHVRRCAGASHDVIHSNGTFDKCVVATTTTTILQRCSCTHAAAVSICLKSDDRPIYLTAPSWLVMSSHCEGSNPNADLPLALDNKKTPKIWDKVIKKEAKDPQDYAQASEFLNSAEPGSSE